MAYSQGGKIEATDINGFVSTGTPNFNNIWSIGSGNSGYGQTALPTVAIGDKVAQNPWNSLVTNIAKAASHQGPPTTITSITAPVTGDKIAYLAALSTNLSAINTNRLNAIAQDPAGPVPTTKTNSTVWGGAPALYTLTMTSTVTFQSADQARFFFNAGGQTKIQLSHPPGAAQPADQIDGFLNLLCASVGTLVLSSDTATIATLPFTGTTKVGGSGSSPTTGIGFYNLTTSQQTLITQTNGAHADYSASSIVVQASYSGSTITYTVNFSISDADLSGGNPSPVLGTQLVTIYVKPSPANLADTWGTVTVA